MYYPSSGTMNIEKCNDLGSYNDVNTRFTVRPIEKMKEIGSEMTEIRSSV
jgi:hypothetical protein